MPRDYALPLEHFYQWEKSKPDRVYLRQAKEGEWVDYSWAQVAEYAVSKRYERGVNTIPEGTEVAWE